MASARNRVLAVLTGAALVTALGAAPASADPADVEVSISVSIVTPQPWLPRDPGGVTMQVVAKVASCPNGCTLTRWGSRGADYFQEDVATQAATAGPTTITAVVRHEDPSSVRYSYYEVHDASTGEILGTALHPLGGWFSQDELAYGPGWSLDSDLGSTETLVRRASAPGATATFTVPDELPAGVDGQVGILSARGPNNGVVTVRTSSSEVPVVLDLRAPRWTPRQLVAVVAVQGGDVVTVENTTSDGRTGSDVHVDGVVVNYANGFGPRPGRDLDRTAPGLEVTVATGQQLPADAGSAQVDLLSRTRGCPAGCTVAQVDPYGGLGARVVDRWVSPADGTLQTHTTSTVLNRIADDEPVVGYRLAGPQGRFDTAPLGLRYWPESRLQLSDGWTTQPDARSVGGSLARSSAPGAGATLRLSSERSGQAVGVVSTKGPDGGVMRVYVQGRLVSSVDLYADTWQPRQVVASTWVPRDARITIQNRTPAGRAASVVNLDGLVAAADPTCYSC